MAKLIGTNPNQVPTNADLGSAAYTDTQNMPETRFTNRALSAKFGAAGDVPTNLATDLDFVQISGSTFIQTGSDAQAFIKTNNYWNGAGTSYVDTTRGSTTIRLNENNAGIFQIETAPSGGTATSNRFRIDEDGHVTMPAQSAFCATKNAAQNNFSIATEVAVSYGAERFDNNSDYNTSTSVFTAPVTGKYQFNVNLRLQGVDVDAGYYHMHLRTSNFIYPIGIIDPNFTGDLNYLNLAASIIVDMDTNDTAYVSIYQSSGLAQTDMAVTNDSQFSGFLVC